MLPVLVLHVQFSEVLCCGGSFQTEGARAPNVLEEGGGGGGENLWMSDAPHQGHLGTDMSAEERIGPVPDMAIVSM
jgi:hypothetical protein